MSFGQDHGTLWAPHGSGKESEILLNKGFGRALFSGVVDFLKKCGFIVIDSQLFMQWNRH